MAEVTPPGAEEVGRLAAVARLLMPDTPLMLGCARPAGPAKVPMERLAVLAGANVVAYPGSGDGAAGSGDGAGDRVRGELLHAGGREAPQMTASGHPFCFMSCNRASEA